ncbi:MAG: phosphoribosyl-AMP cyclohydrolase [Gammaproteobacteria bacterium]|nr:MAG: phosphoribosyl-AMP cyclohydrolase [Gammaproteobacteria bacterium]
MFDTLEGAPTGTQVALDAVFDALRFDAEGLLPAIAQHADSGEILMFAWMNREALRETLQSGRVCYFSRSRRSLWRKGEASGNVQRLKELRFDCDGDVVLMKIDQTGPACHTGRATCFYLKVDGDQVIVDRDIDVDPEAMYEKS